jgi:hypothetical protein
MLFGASPEGEPVQEGPGDQERAAEGAGTLPIEEFVTP